MKQRHRLLLVAAIATAAVSRAASPPVVLPPDAGAINVREAPYRAKGDGVADDTAALQAAFRAAIDRQGRYAAPPFVFIPAGTYLVTNTLAGRLAPGSWADGWRAGLLVMGAGPEHTVLRLVDGAPGFGDPAQPKPVIVTGSESDGQSNPGGGGNRAFRHALIGLTVDTGDNRGAVGIDYIASNRGAIEDVRIVSGPGGGVTGLALDRNWPGPSFVKRLHVRGFDHGITLRRHWQYGMTFEHVTLENQRTAGLLIDNNVVCLRGLTSRNRVPAARLTGDGARLVLIEGTLAGGAPDATAIVAAKGKLLLRDVAVDGYGAAVDDATASRKLTDRAIRDYATDTFSLQQPAPPPLRLPVEETPEFAGADLADWISPTRFGATPGKGDDDDGPALQKAIEAGKPVVYLTCGSYVIRSPLVIRGPVRRIVGFQSSISSPKETPVSPLVRFEGEAGETTTLEHLWFGGPVEHAGQGTLAIRHCDLTKGYANAPAGTGKLFVEDIIGRAVIAHPQAAWFRQLNTEFGEKPLFENHGGTVWMLGFKTEGEPVAILQTAGRLELLGALFYPLREPPAGRSLFVLEGGEAALSYRMNGKDYPVHVTQKIGGKACYWRRGEGQRHGPARFTADATTPAAPPPKAPEGPLGAPPRNWTDEQGNPGSDAAGNRWTVAGVNNVPAWARAADWKPLERWNGGARRWEKAEGMSDQAPSFAPERALLRVRPSGQLAALTFAPAAPGRVALTGRAKVATWGPAAPMNVVVAVVRADAAMAVALHEAPIGNGQSVDWSAVPALQAIDLNPGDRLALLGWNTGGGSGTLEFTSDPKAPTRIEAR